MTPPALLTYDSVDVGWGGEPIVRGATLSVRGGEVVGLLGPNGAGKSTLLKAITGEAVISAGSLRIGDDDVTELAVRERARTVAVVPQQVSAAFSFPAFEFVQMGRHPHLPRFARLDQADRTVVESAMRLTDTTHLAEQPVDQLSGGDMQRVAFAQALAQEPKVLLLDEPVSHLDLNHRLQVLDLTRELAARGLAVLIVFHELDLAARYSDRVAVVSSGRLGEAGPPAEVITSSLLREVFGVRAVVGMEPVTGALSVTPVLREQQLAETNRGSVMVVGGSGTAATLVRRLTLGGWRVSSGALNVGDADAAVCDALGLAYTEIPPFAPMSEQAVEEVRQRANTCDATVVCDVPFGNGNIANLRAAVESRRPLLLIGDIEGRDFTGGLAEALWAKALADGAVVVPDEESVPRALDALLS